VSRNTTPPSRTVRRAHEGGRSTPGARPAQATVAGWLPRCGLRPERTCDRVHSSGWVWVVVGCVPGAVAAFKECAVTQLIHPRETPSGHHVDSSAEACSTLPGSGRRDRDPRSVAELRHGASPRDTRLAQNGGPTCKRGCGLGQVHGLGKREPKGRNEITARVVAIYAVAQFASAARTACPSPQQDSASK
jgi:hypothetical protein